MNIVVTPRRAVGISGFDVGSPIRGMGQCVGGYDEYGDACTDFSPITSDPTATATANAYLNSPASSNAANTANMPYTGNLSPPSSGFNLNSLLTNLIGAGAKIGTQAIASPGTTILPNGTVVTGQGTSALLGSSSSLTPILLIAGLGLVVVMMSGRR